MTFKNLKKYSNWFLYSGLFIVISTHIYLLSKTINAGVVNLGLSHALVNLLGAVLIIIYKLLEENII